MYTYVDQRFFSFAVLSHAKICPETQYMYLYSFSLSGVRNHRFLLGPLSQGRSLEDHARPEADPCRSTYPLQGKEKGQI